MLKNYGTFTTMLLVSQQRPPKKLKDLMKHTSCVNATDLVHLHQILHEQLLNYYKNKMLISRHKTNITVDQYR